MSKPIYIPAFSLEAGQKPIRDVTSRGALKLRPWQIEGLAALRSSTLRILLAPTGSGKSTLMKALSALDLAADPKRKAVIAVPQSIIAGSFGEAPIVVDGKTIAWSADHLLINTSGSIAKLEAFLRAPAASDLAGRIVVCTHQSIVLAHQRMMKGRRAKKSPWHNVSLFIDEAHHSRSADEDEDADDATKSNQLGAVVAHYLDTRPGPLLLTTATWMRAALDDIIPKGHEDSFTRYTHTLEADLRSKQHLKNVSFRFLIGPVDDCLRAIYNEGNKKTIVYLPHVGSAEAKAAGGKANLLAKYMGAIGENIGGDNWTTMLSHKPAKGRAFGVRSLDLVTVEGRDDRKDCLTAAIRGTDDTIRTAVTKATTAGKAQGILTDDALSVFVRPFAIAAAKSSAANTADLLWALGLGKEGFDLPELERAIVVGARGSIPEVLQMMGRVLRDHPGKGDAEFNVVLPHNGGDMDPRQVVDYMKMILASMVVEWPFKLPNLAPAATRGGHPKNAPAAASIAERMEDPAEAVRVIEAVVDRAIQGGGKEQDDAVIAGALKGLYPKASDDERDEAAGRVKQMFTSRSKAMMANAADLPFDVEVTDGALGCVRALAMQFGHSTIGEIRDALGDYNAITATVEELHAFGQGMTARQYNMSRLPGMPDACAFRYHYDGMSFQEVMTGIKSVSVAAVTATIEEVRAFCQGMTQVQYNTSRLPGMPSSTIFPKRYGMTLGEAMNGIRGHAVISATIEEVRAFSQGMTAQQYRAARLTGMPSISDFPRCYGLTFAQVRDGVTPPTSDMAAE